MDLSSSSPLHFIFSFFFAFLILSKGVLGATFTFVNKCESTVWPGILANAGSPTLQSTGFELPQDSSRTFTAPTGWSGRFWGRTSCSFEGSGSGSCGTGDCGSGEVECNGAGASPPATLAEFTLGTGGQDFYDVSLVDGYNLPMVVEASGGSGMCATTGCVTDLNQICPSELKSGGGDACRSACEAFNKPEYCCSGAYNSPAACKPSMYSQMFKSACPRSYSYAYDDPTSTFTCSGADYTITFCPSTPSQKSTKDTTPTTTTPPNGDGSYGGSTGVVDPAIGGTGSSSGQMGAGSGAGFEYGAGTGYGSGSQYGSGYGTGSEYGSGTETQPGSGSQAMLADGSYLAGLAMGESTRAFSATALNLLGSALAVTLISFVFL
ncbi:thaumatin-like protein 1 [Capsicum chacoense]|uniref:Thaumatin-like protein 1 n=1 Tax=Capsicum annuum TaxID=4072 RepID=A0A1U8E9D2_CAPAN|nr:thaumatin-like protein 1 [Capsicum annuum]KAF3653891.1 Thaumatin-like protein 1 [Capsicum annuum]KAF3674500.1 Thaumatin-like protein 1 [Capsicum annuum]PHT64020.1 Thaumatin-like protein 1 [Capsicum annuum]